MKYSLIILYSYIRKHLIEYLNILLLHQNLLNFLSQNFNHLQIHCQIKIKRLLKIDETNRKERYGRKGCRNSRDS